MSVQLFELSPVASQKVMRRNLELEMELGFELWASDTVSGNPKQLLNSPANHIL